LIVKTGSGKVRAWLFMLLPGITIAGSFVVLGRFGLAIGIVCGYVLWIGSIGVLGVCTREIIVPITRRRRLFFVLIHVAKYALIALVVYAVVKHPEISVTGLAIGYTAGMAGFIAAQSTDSGADVEENDAASVS